MDRVGRLSFGLLLGAYLGAAACGAVTIWDGSYGLYRILNDLAPWTDGVHGRWHHTLLSWPAVLLARSGAGLVAIQLTWGLCYALVPLATQLVLLRGVAPHAPARAALLQGALLLGALPMGPSLISETTQAGQIAAVLLALAGLPQARRGWVAALAFMPLLVLMHPVALVAALLVALAFGRRRDAPRAARALLWLLLGAGAVYRAVLGLSAYEREELQAERLLQQLRWALAGSEDLHAWPAAYLAAALLAVTALAWAGRLAPERVRLRRGLAIVGLGSALAAAALAAIWASSPEHWARALAYRRFALVVVLALAAPVLATLAGPPLTGGLARAQRASGLLWTAAFCVCLVALSAQWLGLQRRLAHALAQAPRERWLVGPAELEWLRQTPLRGWMLPFQSVLVQGRAPECIAVSDQARSVVPRGGAIALPVNAIELRDGGWFDYSRLRARLQARGR